jgi:lipid A 4'-phosphatase
MDFEQGVTIGGYRFDPIVLSILFILIVAAIFAALPQLDIWATWLFHDPEYGFPVARLPIFRALRQLNNVVITVTMATLFASIVLKLALPDQPSLIRPQISTFLITTLVVGNVLIVNWLLKGYSGRPRPVHVDQFGGELPFVRAGDFSGECVRNCSFVSGEGSSAFWIFAIWMVAPPHIRRVTFVPAVVYVVAISLNRIAFGAHFLSDVLLSWGVMALVVAVAHRFLIANPPDWLSDERQEARLARAGRAIRAAIGLAPGAARS